MQDSRIRHFVALGYAVLGTIIGSFFYAFYPSLLPAVVLVLSFSGLFYFAFYGSQPTLRWKIVYTVFFLSIVLTIIVENLSVGPVPGFPTPRSIGYVLFVIGLVLLWYQAFFEIFFQGKREKWLSFSWPLSGRE